MFLITYSMNRQLSELEEQIIHYNSQYREGKPEISDLQYDSLIEQLKSEQPDSTLFQSAVIELAPESRKDNLPISMMSLEKLKTIESLLEWCRSKVYLKLIDGDEMDFSSAINFVITPKLDGLSIERNEKNFSWTRGDGFIGQRCDKHCSHLKDHLNETHITRGEMIITNEDWNSNSIFREYKNPRNTVGGWLTSPYKVEVPYDKMSYICYDLFLPDNFLDKEVQLNILNNTCNTIPIPFRIVRFEELNRKFLRSLFDEWKQIFPMDGLVIDVNTFVHRIGVEANGNPSYAVAYKDPEFSEKKETKILKLTRNINRFGVVTPTIEVEPIELSGSTISKVNGINMSYIYDWGLFEGQEITIVRSGEVIPKIVQAGSVVIPFIEEFESQKDYQESYNSQVAKRDFEVDNWKLEKKFDEYLTCPFCGEALVWDKTFINQVCINSDCKEKKLQKVVDFFKILEVEEIAEATFRTLFSYGYETVNDILSITKTHLIGIEGFGDISSDKFLKEIERVKFVGFPAARLMHASSLFPNLGEKTLQLILNSIFGSKPLPITVEHLTTINGIGQITAEVFVQGINKWQMSPELGNFAISYYSEPEKKAPSGPLFGEKYCFTGCRPSEEQKALIEELGGEIIDSVSSKTTHLIVKTLDSVSSKTTKAKSLGIPISSLNDFITKLVC